LPDLLNEGKIHHLRSLIMKKAVRRKFTEAFQQQAIALIEKGQSQASVARKLEISDKTLSRWWLLHSRGKDPVREGRRVSEEAAEMARLKAENAELRLEAEILKKATAYFAKRVK
jgi:transposase